MAEQRDGGPAPAAAGADAFRERPAVAADAELQPLPEGWTVVHYYYHAEVESGSLLLPAGWVELINASSGMPYYYHAESNETRWERPVAPAPAPAPAREVESGTRLLPMPYNVSFMRIYFANLLVTCICCFDDPCILPAI